MSKILIVSKQSRERSALCLVMEFAGHHCNLADSLDEAVQGMSTQPPDIVLVDSSAVIEGPEAVIRQLRSVSPRTEVLVLTEEAPVTRTDEIITHPQSPVERLSTQFSTVARPDAVEILLPERESLKSLSRLPETAGMLNKLAVLYHSQRKYGTAARLYQRALKLCETEPGSQTREVATILNNLARLYHDQDRLEDAEPLYRRSLAIAEKVFGPRHAKVAVRARNLADLYRAQGRHEDAAVLHKRLASIESETSK